MSSYGPLLRAAQYIFKGTDGETLAHTGAPIDALVFAGLECDLFHNFTNVVRQFGMALAVALSPGLLRGDGHTFGKRSGIMGANFRPDAVLQRGDDFSTRGVVLGIRSEDEKDVQSHAHRVSLNLNVAFLHDVEEANLDFSGEVRQFV